MSIAPYLKEIGRGKDGARALSQAQAHDLMAQVLDRQVSEAERGAFAIAMRIKGETTEELAGFTAAALERSLVLEGDVLPVLLPSYNGARKLPNLTALLALLLAQEGVPVLVHGPESDPARVTTHELFATLGLRNPGHTVAKLLQPRGGACLRVVNYTHPEYALAHARYLQHTAAHALLMRGTEGEPVADARRLPKLEVFIGGALRSELGRAATEGALATLPLLPRASDVATTALYIQGVVSGEKPAPAPLLEQLDVLVRTRLAAQQHQESVYERSA